VKPAAVALVLAALTLFAFAPALDNGFVNWDDEGNFLRNDHYRGLGPSQLTWGWTTFHLGAYQPLGWTLWSIEYQAWGLAPRGYHAVSILLHSAVVTALYALTMTLLRRCQPADSRGSDPALWAGVAVAWYAVHPLRVEAVAWISCQSYLLCALFFVLALLSYLRAFGAGPASRARWLNTSLALYVISLLGKAPSVGLPAVLVILDIYPLRRLGSGPREWFGPSSVEVWREKTRFFVVGLIFAGLAYVAKASTFNGTLSASRGLLTRAAVACYGVCFYIAKTIVPRDISAFYAVSGPVSWSRPLFLGSALAVVGLVAALAVLGRRWPGLAATGAAALVILAPVSGFVSISTQLTTDRYTYLAATPWVLPVASGLGWFASPGRRPRWVVALAVVACLAGIAGLAFQTRGLCRTWRDSEALWIHALAHGSGRSQMAYNNLAATYQSRGELDRAIEIYRTALKVPPEPTDPTGRVLVLYNLGTCLEAMGKLDEATAQFAEIARLLPFSPDAHYHWGRLLAAQGRYQDAAPHFREALRLNPDHAKARDGLNIILSIKQ
jgi:hypothetical protein